MKLIKIFNEENLSDDEIGSLVVRKAARGILFDNDNNIALLHSLKFNYYDLPGGGIEKGETIEEGLLREILEETGCKAKISNELGKTVEVRAKKNQKNIRYGYVLKLEGEKGEPMFKQDEIDEGFELLWLKLEVAQELIGNSVCDTTLYTEYIKQRTLFFLKEFQL
jgi:8-oxo-dGTP diphosphatase